MKWIAIIVIAFLLAGASLTAWQLVETQRAAVALSNSILELDTEVAALEAQIIEVEGDKVKLYDYIVELEARQTETYYQGVYSFCMIFNAFALTGGATELVDCDAMLSGAYAQKWHEREAPGFDWPPVKD